MRFSIFWVLYIIGPFSYPLIFGQGHLLFPGNMFVVGYDNDIDANGSDLFVLRTLVELEQGDHIGITDLQYIDDQEGGHWNLNGQSEVAQIILQYNDKAPLKSDSELHVFVYYSSPGELDQIEIKLEGNDVTSLFDVTSSGSFFGLQEGDPSSLYLFQGEWAVENNTPQLNGHLLSGVQFDDQSNQLSPDGLEDDGILSIPQIGEGYGIIICDSLPLLCGFGEKATDSGSWDIVSGGSAANDIIDPELLQKICNIPEPDPEDNCPTVMIEQLCDEGCIDVIFLLDNSSSVQRANPDEMSMMISTIQSTVHELDDTGIDLRYSVTQFARDYQFEVTIPFTSDPEIIDGLQAAFTGGTDVRCAVENVIASIDDSALVVRPNCARKFVLVTDAAHFIDNQGVEQSDYFRNNCSSYENGDRFDRYNQIKQAPYNFEVSVVYYETGSAFYDVPASEVCAAIASKGGSYLGNIYPNPSDPENGESPRRLTSTTFVEGVPGLANNIMNCEKLNIDINHYCINPQISWSSTNGGQILSDSINVNSIDILSVGDYMVEVLCENNCTLRDTVTIDSTGGIEGRSNYENRRRLVNGQWLLPHEYEQYLIDPSVFEKQYNPSDAINIYPNPTRGDLHILLPRDFGSINRAQIYQYNGILIQDADLVQSGNQQYSLQTSGLCAGIYFLVLHGQDDVYQKQFILID